MEWQRSDHRHYLYVDECVVTLITCGFLLSDALYFTSSFLSLLTSLSPLPLPLQLFPILVQSLDSSEVELKVSTLEGLTVVTQDAPSVITSHVPTLIPKLLELAKCPDTMV